MAPKATDERGKPRALFLFCTGCQVRSKQIGKWREQNKEAHGDHFLFYSLLEIGHEAEFC